jgi:hypothetical protein
MRADTRSVSLDAQANAVFEYIADPRNLPRWAVGFAREVRSENGRWFVLTAHDEIALEVAADAALGTIDFHMSPSPGVSAVAYSRVLAAGDGAEYVFTQFQSDGMPDAVFEAQVTALREELTVLQSIIKARAACAS